MPLTKNNGQYGELGHWGKRDSRKFTKKKILLLGTLLSLSLIFAISHNGNILPIVNAVDYNSGTYSHTRTNIFTDTSMTGSRPYIGYTAGQKGTASCGANCDGPSNVTFGTGSIVQAPFTGKLISVFIYTGSSLANQLVISTGGTSITTTNQGCSGGGNCPFASAGQSFTVQDVEAITVVGTSANTLTLANPVSVGLNQWVAISFMRTGGVANIIQFCGADGSPACHTVPDKGNFIDGEINFSSTSPIVGSSHATVTNDVGPSHMIGATFSANPAVTPSIRWNYNSTCVLGTGGSFTFRYSTGSAGSGGNNCNSADVMISKTSVNLQSVAGRMLEIVSGWEGGNGAGPPSDLIRADIILRTNGTLPVFTETYDPFNDTNARLIWSICSQKIGPCNSLSGTISGAGGVSQQAVWVAHDNAKTISQETPPNDFIIQGAVTQFLPSQLIENQIVLNYTGPNNFINSAFTGASSNVTQNLANGLQFGQSYYIMVKTVWNTANAPMVNDNIFWVVTASTGNMPIPFGMFSVPASCNDPLNKTPCSLGTATPVFQFNPLDPSSWGNAIIQGLLWVFTVAVPTGLKVVAAVLLQFLDVTFNFVGNQLGWGNIGDNIVTFINGLPSLFAQVGAVLGNLASIVSSVINTIIIANLLANPYFAGLVNILNDVKNVLSAGLVINFLTEIAIWFPTSYMIILISTYFLFVLLKGLHGFFDWIHLVKWSSFQMVGLFSLFIYVFGKLITALLGRLSIISPGHEFPYIPHPDPGDLPKISFTGEVAFFDDPTAWFLGFTGLVFTMMWAGTSAAGLPGNTQTIIQSFSGLFLVLFGAAFMVLILYIPGFLLGKMYEKGIIS